MRTRSTLNRSLLPIELFGTRVCYHSCAVAIPSPPKWCVIFHLLHCQRTEHTGKRMRAPAYDEFYIENDGGGGEAAENGRIHQD